MDNFLIIQLHDFLLSSQSLYRRVIWAVYD